MKNSFKTHFTFLAFLLAFSFSAQVFGQPPAVRKEAGDGGNGYRCDVLNLNRDQTVCYSIHIYDTTFLNSCNLHAGYQHQNSPMEYVQLGDFVYSPITESYMIRVCITFSANDIAERCENGFNYINFNLGLFCLNEGQFLAMITQDLYPSDTKISICCEVEDPPIETNNPLDTLSGGQNEPGNGAMKSNFKNKDFQLNKNKDINLGKSSNSIDPKYSDYYVYDLSGNPISIIKNIDSKTKIQTILSRQSLDTGIYFVRFWDGSRIKTEKIFIP